MDEFKFFKNFKERGEWVELRFMAEALRRGFKILRPWGDSSPFDVAIQFGNRIVRVQVKSTSCRVGTGYFCQFKPNYFSDPYTLDQLDFFAAYVIMQDTWYLIPASPPGRTSTQTRPDALPHAAPKEKPLPLRTLPRSLAPTVPPTGKKQAAQEEIALVGRTLLPVAFDLDVRSHFSGRRSKYDSYQDMPSGISPVPLPP